MKRTLAVAMFALSAFAQAQPYPTKPIRLLVTYPPGGGADLVARLIAPQMAATLGQPVVVENRPGASGMIGAEAVARSAPDGYTLMLDASAHAVNPSLYPKIPYDTAKAFAPVSLLVVFPNMLVVSPSVRAKSVQELIDMARARPGGISFASSGNGSAQHLAAELFRQRLGLNMVHIPYKGGGPALADVMAGQVPVFFGNMASTLPHVQAGRLRALAVTGSARSPNVRDLPTIAESGAPGYEVYEWNAVFAPAGTATTIVDRLQESIARALRHKDVQERILGLGGEIRASTPQGAVEFIRAETQKWARVVKDGGIKLE